MNAESAPSNAESAEKSTLEHSVKRRKVESSDQAMSDQLSTKTEPPTTDQRKIPCFDATCIDRSVPLPDSKLQQTQTQESNDLLASRDHATSIEEFGSTDSEEKTSTISTQESIHNTKKVPVLKLRRSSATALSTKATELKRETVGGELDIDASLLLSPLEESKAVGGVGEGVGGANLERKKSIAEMKAEM